MAAKIKLLNGEIAKLKTRLDAWPTLTRDRRTSEKEAFVTDFLNTRGEDPKDEWKRYTMLGKITQWFSNHAEHSQNRLPGSLKTHWTARQVFNERMAETIARKQAKIITHATEEGKSMLDIVALNKARMLVWKKLSESKRAEFAEEAESWTAEGPDPLSKLEVMEKRVPGWVDSFSTLMFEQAGAMVHMTFCHVDADGNIVETSYDVSDSWHRQDKKNLQYTKVYPQWNGDFPGTFTRFCRPVLRPNDEFHDEGAVIPKQRATYDPIVLDVYPEGDPILPPISSIPDAQVPRQATMRQFLNAHYALACGIAGVPVPYNTLISNNAKFLCPHSVKEGDIICDPSKMATDILGRVWDHIVKLQQLDDPEQRFRFAKWYNSDTKKYLDAKYDGPPVPKKSHSAGKKTRSGGPPATNPWHADRANARGKVRRDDPASGQNATAAAGLPSQPRPTTGNIPGRSLKAKGKARAADVSDSAASSDEDEPPSDPPLESDASGDDFDFDAVGGLHGGDDIDDEEHGAPGASGTHHDDEPLSSQQPEPESPANSPAPSAAPLHTPVAKHRRDLWAIENAASIPKQPNGRVVEEAYNKPPAWVDHVEQRVYAFLWSLAGERVYHDLLTAWRHMLERRASFKSFPIGHWANWEYKSVALPKLVHQDEKTWGKFLQWIHDAALKTTSSASDVQSWLLVVGMALRDIHVANEVEEDMPVPRSWPEYMRQSPANFQRDLLARLEPMLANTYRPLAEDFLDVSLTAPTVVKVPRTQLPPQAQSSLPTAMRSRKNPPPGGAGAVHEKLNPADVEAQAIPTLASAHVSDLSAHAHQRPGARPRRRGPPGVPAASFPVAPSPQVNGDQADSASSAEVEQAIKVSNARQSPDSARSNQPRSISEGLAIAGALSGRGRHTPVPIVLIQSTIADRLKRRRRGNDDTSPSEPAPQPDQLPTEGNNRADVRRTTRSHKRRRMN